MRTVKYTDLFLMNALNGNTSEANQRLTSWSYHDGDNWYWQDCFRCPPSEEGFTEGDIISVASQVSTISPKDLQQDLDLFDCDEVQDLIVRMFGPSTEGDWEFTDLFKEEFLKEPGDEKLTYTSNALAEIIFKAVSKYIGENPQILSDNPAGFSIIEKTKYFTLSDNMWRLATQEEIANFEKEIANRRADETIKESRRKLILSRLTKEEREILGFKL